MSIYGFFFEWLVLPAVDSVRGQRTMRAYRLLMRSQHWPRERLTAFANAKLARLVAHAYENVPHYRRVMDGIGVTPYDIRTAEDLTALPFLSRDEVRECQEDLLARGVSRDSLEWARTSGTSGLRLRFGRCPNSRMWGFASMYRHYRWLGVRLGERRLTLWGSSLEREKDRHRSALADRLWRRRVLAGRLVTDAEVRGYVHLARQFRPSVIRGYASGVYNFARQARELGIRLPSLKGVSTTADSLTPSMRRAIEEALDAPVFDQYGGGEVLGAAYECPSHDGFHVAEEHNVIEVDAPSGLEGDVAITDLDNYSMPLIRYKNGDCGSLDATNCPCGRASQRLRLTGRREEYILLPGDRRLSRVFFAPIFRHYAWIEAYQVVQIGPTRLEVRLEGETTQERLEVIRRHLLHYLGPDVNINVAKGGISTEPGGKRRLVIPYSDVSTVGSDNAVGHL